MMQRLVAYPAPSGRLSMPGAAPALVPPMSTSLRGATNGVITEMASLRSVWYQPPTYLPPTHPEAPLAQRGVAHGPTDGYPVFISIPGPKTFQCRQRQEVPVPMAVVGAPGTVSSMTTAKTGSAVRWSRIGGRRTTAAPFVVPRFPVYGGS